jgi:hypothetical protein
MTVPTSTKHALRLLLDDVADDPVLTVRVKELIAKLPSPVPAGYLVELGETLKGGRFVPKRTFVEDKPDGESLAASTELYAGISHVDKADVEGLVRAAREVMSYIEAAHRPPVRDEIEHGRMARVRLHALASLREALLAFDGEPAAEETQVPLCKQSQAEEAKPTFSLEEFNQSVKALAISNTYVPNVQLLKAMADGKTIKIDLEANVDQAVTIVDPEK